MGGAFLSEPIKSKTIKKHLHNKLRVVTCEMQGNSRQIQAGDGIWKMPSFSNESARKSFYLGCSMVTEESRFHSTVQSTSPPSLKATHNSRVASIRKPSRRHFKLWTPN